MGCLTIVAGLVYSTERRSKVPTGVFSARPALQIFARLAVFIRSNPKPFALSSTNNCCPVHCGVPDPRNCRISPDRRPPDLRRCEPGGPEWSDVGLLRTDCPLPVARIHICSGGRSDCARQLRRGGPRQPKIGCRSPPVAFGRATSGVYENLVRMT